MKTGHSRIQITNPCSEQWGAMSITETGRFCDLCSKNVVDFSSKSDAEIKTYLLERKDEAICGRFYRQQIDRIRIEIDPTVLHSGIPFWQKFLVVLLVSFGPQCFGIDFCFAQTTDSLSAPTAQVDSMLTVPQDTLSLDTLAQDTLSLLPADTVDPEPKVEWVTLGPLVMISGSVCMVPEEVVVEGGVKITFPGPVLAQKLPTAAPAIDHSAGKTPQLPQPEKTPDQQQSLAIIPPIGGKRRK
jgi:hypothetical protein